MKNLESIKYLTLIFMDILGEGFYDLIELKSGTYRKNRYKISNAIDYGPIYNFLKKISSQIQKFAKTQVIADDNEIYCRDTGSDKLLVPFLFLDEYVHLLFLMLEKASLDGFEEILKICIYWCNCHDDSKLQEPDKNMEELFKKGFIPENEYKNFCEFKQRSFRREYYSVCRDIINNRNENSSFFDWPLRRISEKIKTLDWNDNDKTVSSRTIDRMREENGIRRWATIKDIVSISACDRFSKQETILKEYEIFQARILMAYFLENLVNSKNLLNKYKKEYLYKILKDGLDFKP